MNKELLSEETNEVSEIANETKDGPVICPQTESLLIGVGLVGEVSLSQRNDDYDCVVDETSEEFLHFVFSEKSFSKLYKLLIKVRTTMNH